MGARTIRQRNETAGLKKQRLTLLIIAAVLVFPVVLAVALVAMDIRPDLSELKSIAGAGKTGTLTLGWADLSGHGEVTTPVRLIGYMMDGSQAPRNGACVSSFILLPEAGHFLHPAHHIASRSVAVWTAKPLSFHFRQLVWARGTLNATLASSAGETPAYALTSAEVMPAVESDIQKWFNP